MWSAISALVVSGILTLSSASLAPAGGTMALRGDCCCTSTTKPCCDKPCCKDKCSCPECKKCCGEKCDKCCK